MMLGSDAWANSQHIPTASDARGGGGGMVAVVVVVGEPHSYMRNGWSNGKLMRATIRSGNPMVCEASDGWTSKEKDDAWMVKHAEKYAIPIRMDSKIYWLTRPEPQRWKRKIAKDSLRWFKVLVANNAHSVDYDCMYNRSRTNIFKREKYLGKHYARRGCDDGSYHYGFSPQRACGRSAKVCVGDLMLACSKTPPRTHPSPAGSMSEKNRT